MKSLFLIGFGSSFAILDDNFGFCVILECLELISSNIELSIFKFASIILDLFEESFFLSPFLHFDFRACSLNFSRSCLRKYFLRFENRSPDMRELEELMAGTILPTVLRMDSVVWSSIP